jgi:ribonucleoside-diphosphate reductase alpha chain
MQLSQYAKKLNRDIAKHFPDIVAPIDSSMGLNREGVSQLVMLDRYAYKDSELLSLSEGDVVIATVKDDPKFPARGLTKVVQINKDNTVMLEVFPDFVASAGSEYITRELSAIEKPMEIYYEQICKRVARGLAEVEKEGVVRETATEIFEEQLITENIVPAGRILYGAGSGSQVTFFNCFVMPFVKDSRKGIGEHRDQVMEIMSRGGGVGTNGSTLRPKNALAKGVNGKSSGAVSWLDDIAQLTHLIEQGGSRRGAQMIMLADWHPDIIEFIISKMQNPDILRLIIRDFKDEKIKSIAKDKLKFTPLSEEEKSIYENYVNHGSDEHNKKVMEKVEKTLNDGGIYSVHKPEFLSGANISVCLTNEFQEAIDHDGYYELKFPDVDNYNKKQKEHYNDHWHDCGDVREWSLPVRTHYTIRAKELWKLINLCATYSAEPGIFFIDNANDMTNARAYGQKVVATNPCGEQPLAPYSVCNLLAVNLSNFAKDGELDEEELKKAVSAAVRMGDNVIDATPYFLPENENQAKGERRVGLGVMGLHDLLIKLKIQYGSAYSLNFIDELFRLFAVTAYETSVDLAMEKGSFPFLDRKNALDRFVRSGFASTLPEELKFAISKFGIRNSHLLTVAPTGSTGTMIGCSTGLEPYFAFSYYRSGRLGQNIEVDANIVKQFREEENWKEDNLPHYFVSSMDISPEAHAAVQCTIQRWIDSSISKTVNAPKGTTIDDVSNIYNFLWENGAKGGTVYVDGSRNAQVLSLKDDENGKETSERKIIIEEVKPLRETHVGSNSGDSCSVCQKGTLIEAGGCVTCNQCGSQIKCGL